MSAITFNHSNQDGRQTLAVFLTTEEGEQVNKIVAPANPSFKRLVEYLITTPEDQYDVEYVHGLVDPSIGIGRLLKEEFGDRVTFDLRQFRIDGIPMEGRLATHVRDMVLAGDDDWQRLVRFLVNVEANPSYTAQQFLWQWVQDNGMTITEDGRILGYKGVQHNGFSVSSGPNNFVNGVLYKDGESTQVPHEVGSVISKRRQDVDDSSIACSTGLHVGTEKYARDFAPRLMTVIFNPKDVVGGSQGWKIRVSEYEVHSLAEREQFSHPSYNVNPEPAPEPEPDEDDDSDESADLDAVSPDPVEEEPEVLPSADLSLPENAALLPDLKRDLEDPSLGHKAVGRKWSDFTTESSVRRYRKSHGIQISLGSKVRDAVS